MKNILINFPSEDKLLSMFPEVKVLQVNAHLHSPYSFSAFSNVKQMFEMAENENISVLGINDFYVADGYDEFYSEACRTGIFPLFNIEHVGLIKKEQEKSVRVNDPDNPGRCYISGKGLDFPFNPGLFNRIKINSIIKKNQDQIKKMIDLVNTWLARLNVDISFSYEGLKKDYAKDLVRERHLARAIRVAIFDKYRDNEKRIKILTTVFSEKAPKSDLNDYSALENEIRSNLIKSGGVAYVKEDENAFLELYKLNKLILNAGGIPCYPVLLDDKNGNFTEFEKDPELLFQNLINNNVICIEFIPGRNSNHELERFVKFFNEKDFIILFGTEHNTPDLLPLQCVTRDKSPLSYELQKISYEGCCIIAAHQYLRAKGMKSFIDKKGVADLKLKKSFIKLGNSVIHYFNKQLIDK